MGALRDITRKILHSEMFTKGKWTMTLPISFNVVDYYQWGGLRVNSYNKTQP